MAYQIDTTQRSIVYTRPAITRAPTNAEGAGQRVGEPYYNEFAEPFSLAAIVVYPDAAGTVASPKVVAVARTDGAQFGRLDMMGQALPYATEADFAAVYLKDYRAPGASTAPTTVDYLASTLSPEWRWQKTENAKET